MKLQCFVLIFMSLFPNCINNIRYIRIVAYNTDTLPDGGRETNIDKTAVARQCPVPHNGSNFGCGVSHVVCSEAISHD
jgi:hypothetical protein